MSPGHAEASWDDGLESIAFHSDDSVQVASLLPLRFTILTLRL